MPCTWVKNHSHPAKSAVNAVATAVSSEVRPATNAEETSLAEGVDGGAVGASGAGGGGHPASGLDAAL